jgi:hypothetical protein
MMAPSESRLDHSAPRKHFAALMRGFSLEATLPGQSELDELGLLRTARWVSGLPGRQGN